MKQELGNLIIGRTVHKRLRTLVTADLFNLTSFLASQAAGAIHFTEELLAV